MGDLSTLESKLILIQCILQQVDCTFSCVNLYHHYSESEASQINA